MMIAITVTMKIKSIRKTTVITPTIIIIFNDVQDNENNTANTNDSESDRTTLKHHLHQKKSGTKRVYMDGAEWPAISLVIEPQNA
eukprot:scaffold506032_cov17-Prasinocladus_malaysianus.AAC.1